MANRSAKSKTLTLLGHYIAMLLAVLLFSMGRFGFMTVLGIKRPVEVALLSILLPIGIILMLSSLRVWRNTTFLLCFVFFMGEWLIRGHFLSLLDLAVATIMVAMVSRMGVEFSDVVLKVVIVIAGIFGLLGIIQCIILLADPSLIQYAVLPGYGSSYSGTEVLIRHPLALLGGTSGESYLLFGRPFTRVESFCTEPSRVVVVFMIPGALALTYSSRIRLLGWVSLLFCVASCSGSFFASLFFAFISLPLLLVKRSFPYAVLPFLICLFIIFILINYRDAVFEVIRWVGTFTDFLNKMSSAKVRFSGTVMLFFNVISNPFGTRGVEGVIEPTGMFLRSVAQAGVIGFVIWSAVMIKLSGMIGKLLVVDGLGRQQKCGLLLLYGGLIAICVIHEVGVVSTLGFTLLALTYYRLKSLDDVLRARRNGASVQKGSRSHLSNRARSRSVD